jgi:hypothetical protein
LSAPFLLLVAALASLDLGLPRAPRDARDAKWAGCPAEARVEVNLPAWRAALQQAATPERRDALLEQIKLELPEDEAPSARFTLAAVDDVAVQLEPGARADHLVQLRFRDTGSPGEAPLLLAQVLRPRGPGAFCAIGGGLVPPDARATTYTLSLLPLLDAKTKVIQIERTRAEPRESETRRELWAARGPGLQKIFDATIGHMRSEPGGATTTTVGTLTLAGGFPRRIELTSVSRRGGCEVRAGDAPCEDGGAATTTIWTYDGAKYQASTRKDKEPPAR